MSFFEELRRRNVVRVGTAYLALGWVIIEISGTVVPALQLPPWTTSLLIWLGLAGLPFVLLFAWIYELTPEGLKRESQVDRTSSITPLTARRLDYAIIALLVLAIGLFALDRFGRERPATPVADATAVIAAPTPGAPARSGKSIAVLPFANMSDDKDNEFFGDGLAEELLNLLAKVPDLKVAARTSSFHFKGKDPTIAEVAAALQVDTVLEGSVRRSGDTIRVVAQLINAADGSHLWSEKYDRPLTDLFAVQDDIAGNIVGALLPHLGAAEAKLASSDTGEIAPGLFERFMRARHRFYDKTPAASEYALGEFQQVTAQAPGYAPAWAWLARAWIANCTCSGGKVVQDISFTRAQQAIDTAVKLEPGNALALLAQGMLLRRKDHPQDALVEIERALAKDPMLVDAHIQRERNLVGLGRPDEAIEGLEKARALDPLHPEVLYDLAHLLNLQGRKREAFAAVEQLYAINPVNATELELHLYSDSNEIGRDLYLADLAWRNGGKDIPPDRLGPEFLGNGMPRHPAVAASSYAPVALALAGRAEEARAALARQTDPSREEATDARLLTRIVLGDFDAAREELWAKWSALPVKSFNWSFYPAYGAMLIALLQQDDRGADAKELIAAFDEEVRTTSPLHQAGYQWFLARQALAHGNREAAIAAYQKLAQDGSVGNRVTGGIDFLLGELATDPRLQPVIQATDANLATQLAEFERLKASGMTAEAARKEYVSSLP